MSRKHSEGRRWLLQLALGKAVIASTIGITTFAFAGQRAGDAFNLGVDLGLASYFSVDGDNKKFQSYFFETLDRARTRAADLASVGIPLNTSIISLNKSSAQYRIGDDYARFFYNACLQAREQFEATLKDFNLGNVFSLGVTLSIAEGFSSEAKAGNAKDSIERARAFARQLSGQYPFLVDSDFDSLDHGRIEAVRLRYSRLFKDAGS